MLIDFALSQTSIVLRLKVRQDATGAKPGQGFTGLLNTSTGLIVSTVADNEATATTYTAAGSTIDSITTLGTYAAPTAGHCRLKQVDATNNPGIVELQIADARFAVTSAKSLLISITGVSGLADTDVVIPLRSINPYDAVRGGMTALPNAAAAASGGLPTIGVTIPNATAGAAGGLFIAGTNAATTVTTSFTTTFTGNLTGSVASVTGAVGSVTGAVGSVTGAVGSVTGNVGGSVTGSVGSISGVTFPANFSVLAIAAATGQVGLDWSNIKAPTTTVNLSGTTISTTQAVASVSGSVGSVTGAVGSVTGGVGGNVTGSVGSIAGITFPANFAALGISSGGKINGVVLTDALTTYTGNTPQTGDSYARIGAAGAGLTAIGDTRLAHLDADVSTRLATSGYTVPPTAAALATAVWTDTTSSDFTAAGSPGKLLMTNLDVVLSTRLATSGYTTPPTASAISTAVLTNATDTTTAGSLGYLVGHAPSWYTAPSTPPTATAIATAVWTDLVAGSDFTTTGSVGKLLTTNVDATVSSRLATSGYTTPPTTSAIAAAVLTDTTDTGTAGSLGYLIGNAPGWYTTPATPPTATAIATAVWTDLVAGSDFATTGSVGKLLVTNLDAAVSSRLASGSYAAPPSAATIATATATAVASGSVGSVTAAVTVGGYSTGQDPATLVLDATASAHNTAGTIGAKISSAASAGDPWSTSLPGSYTAGQAGYIIGHFLDATVSSRSTFAGGNVTVGGYASGQDPATLVLDAVAANHTTTGTIGAKINAAGSASDPWGGIITAEQAGTAVRAIVAVVAGSVTESGDHASTTFLDVFDGTTSRVTSVQTSTSRTVTIH